jgi:hypothetical protein
MITKAEVWHKPSVTIQQETIDIGDRTHSIKLELEQVSKMGLSKNKMGFTAMLGMMWFAKDSAYDLHILIKNSEEITIRIKGFHHQYYINLISRVRRRIVAS